ncbi:MAG: acyl-CoA dehydrogenase family protein [Mycetocola sp.]
MNSIASQTLDVPVGFEAARQRLGPVFATIASRAAERDLDRSLPLEEVRLLAQAGFGALRLPVNAGGAGLTVTEFTALLIELGTADSNQPQLWRNHIAFVEDRVWHRDAPGASEWLHRIASGDVVGGAWSERATVPGAGNSTRFDASTHPPTVTGTKYYSTGSIYGDWISVAAKADDESDVFVLVDARGDGVELFDDWGGIGQRLTGSGTTIFDRAAIAGDAVFRSDERAPHQEIIYQIVLLASLAGVALSARDEAAAAVRARVRNYPQGLAAAPRDDAIVQQAIGGVAAAAAAARAVVLNAASELDAGLEELERTGTRSAIPQPAASFENADAAGTADQLRAAAVATWEAQLVAADAALRASTELYDALGSSAVERSTGLDRHWRNARTLVSHNPRGYKERLVGDWYVNQADPSPWARKHESQPPHS